MSTAAAGTRVATVFTSNGSLAASAYPNAKALRIRGVNGGGGSGGVAATTSGTNSAASGGGAGGAYAERTLPIAAFAFPLTITVGAAGAGGTAGANTGGKGGQSTVTNGATTYWTPGVQATGQGGGGGSAANTITGAAGVAGFDNSVSGSVADFVAVGSGGANGTRWFATLAMGAVGGNSTLGGGGSAPSGTGSGIAGGNYGGGAGGVVANNTSGPTAGISGGPGIVIIEPIY